MELRLERLQERPNNERGKQQRDQLKDKPSRKTSTTIVNLRIFPWRITRNWSNTDTECQFPQYQFAYLSMWIAIGLVCLLTVYGVGNGFGLNCVVNSALWRSVAVLLSAARRE